jgi:hypothetical protein
MLFVQVLEEVGQGVEGLFLLVCRQVGEGEVLHVFLLFVGVGVFGVGVAARGWFLFFFEAFDELLGAEGAC